MLCSLSRNSRETSLFNKVCVCVGQGGCMLACECVCVLVWVGGWLGVGVGQGGCMLASECVCVLVWVGGSGWVVVCECVRSCVCVCVGV